MKRPPIRKPKWPVSIEREEIIANPSHDTQLQEHLIEELMIAVEEHNASKFKDAIQALIQHLHNEEPDAADEG